MFKKNTDEDVSETEYNTVIKPHIDKVNSFHETYYTYALILLEISFFSLLFPYSDLLHRASKKPCLHIRDRVYILEPLWGSHHSIVVREMGIEPTRQCQRCLRPSRLPIPPLSRKIIISYFNLFLQYFYILILQQ